MCLLFFLKTCFSKEENVTAKALKLLQYSVISTKVLFLHQFMVIVLIKININMLNFLNTSFFGKNHLVLLYKRLVVEIY